jgi:HEAT repeats
MFHRFRLLFVTCVACLIAPSLVASKPIGQQLPTDAPIAAVIGVYPPAQITPAVNSSNPSDRSPSSDGLGAVLSSTAFTLILPIGVVGSIAAVLLIMSHKGSRNRQIKANLPHSSFDPQSLQTPALAAREDKPVQSLDNGGAFQPLSVDEARLARSPHPSLSETTRLTKVDIVEALMVDLHNLDPVNRRKAIWELGQRGDSRAIQPLVDLLLDSDSAQRSLILAAVSEIGVRSLKPMNRALMLSIQDDSPDVRKNAIRDVTRICDLVAQVSQLLQYAASDSDPEVRDTAHWALSQLSRIRSLPDQGSALTSPAVPEESSGNGSP